MFGHLGIADPSPVQVCSLVKLVEIEEDKHASASQLIRVERINSCTKLPDQRLELRQRVAVSF